MSSCFIAYIPERLHTRDRPDIPSFELGERLYRRCPEADSEKPFSSISLVDISVNRAGPASLAPLCQPDDVLFNFSPSEKQPGERITGEVVIELTVVELTNSTYEQAKTEQPAATAAITCVIRLLHKKEPCNYAHCAFVLKLDGEEVTFENYKQGLGGKGAAYSRLRDWCRQELGKMYLRQEVREEVSSEPPQQAALPV